MMNESGSDERAALFKATSVCIFVTLLEGFDIQALGVAAPHLVPDLHLSPGEVGNVFAGGNVGLALGSLAVGWLIDRVGLKRMLLCSIVVFSLFTFVTAYVSNFGELLAVRFLAGLGFGGAFPSLIALSEVVGRGNRSITAATLMFCGMPLGGGSAAIVIQHLPFGGQWRPLFEIGGVLPLIVCLLVWLVLPAFELPRKAVTSGSGLSFTLFGEGRTAPTLLLWAAIFPTLLILYLILNWLPLLVIGKHLDKADASMAALAFNYAGVVGAIVIGWLVDHRGMKGPLIVIYAGLIGSLVALGAVTGRSEVLFFSGLAGFCLLGSNYVLYGLVGRYYPASLRGSGAGAAVAVGRIGSVIGPLAAGVMLGAGATSGAVLTNLAPVALVAGLAAIGLSMHRLSKHGTVTQ